MKRFWRFELTILCVLLGISSVNMMPDVLLSFSDLLGTMKALLLDEYRHLAVDVPMPEAGPGEVSSRAACGSGSDVHGYDGSSAGGSPVVMGHEAAGVVAAVGEGVSGFAVGDRVTFDSTVFCGECSFCLRGDVNLCEQRQVLGVSCGGYGRAGGFAEYVTVPTRILYRLPDAFAFSEAAMLEAVSVALHAVRVGELRGGETAMVIGAGMIGLLVVQAGGPQAVGG